MLTQHNNVVRSFLGFINVRVKGRLPGRASQEIGFNQVRNTHNILKEGKNSNDIEINKNRFGIVNLSSQFLPGKISIKDGY